MLDIRYKLVDELDMFSALLNDEFIVHVITESVGVLLEEESCVFTHPFYREYFKPSNETFIEKDRLRWRVIFRGTTFYINLDRMDQPDIGTFLEVKSRTWSLRDAEVKAEMIGALIETLDIPTKEIVTDDYLKFVKDSEADL